MRFAPHNKKIALILSVQQSLKRVLAQRKAMKRWVCCSVRFSFISNTCCHARQHYSNKQIFDLCFLQTNAVQQHHTTSAVRPFFANNHIRWSGIVARGAFGVCAARCRRRTRRRRRRRRRGVGSGRRRFGVGRRDQLDAGGAAGGSRRINPTNEQQHAADSTPYRQQQHEKKEKKPLLSNSYGLLFLISSALKSSSFGILTLWSFSYLPTDEWINFFPNGVVTSKDQYNKQIHNQ